MFRTFRRLVSLFVKKPTTTPVRRARPRLECLEERAVPATFTVTNLQEGGAGSLRQAVEASNSTAGADVIVFQEGLKGTISVTSQLILGDAVSIVGNGSNAITLDGGNITRIFRADPAVAGSKINISGFTLTRGFGVTDGGTGGAVQNVDADLVLTDCVLTGNKANNSGGGAYSAAETLSLVNCTVSNNEVINTGSGFYFGGRGGGVDAVRGALIINDCVITGNKGGAGGGLSAGYFYRGEGLYVGGASLTLRNTTVSNNTGTAGGGVAFSGSVFVAQNCTLSGNIASRSGGALYLFVRSQSTLTNCTISGNEATDDGGGASLYGTGTTATFNNCTIANNLAGLDGSGRGGGIFALEAIGTVNIRNSIVADNYHANKQRNELFNQGSTFNVDFSLIASTPVAGTINGTNTNNIFGVAPGLAPLAFNGGPTQTMALQAGSPAINAGDPAFAGLTFDQRLAPFLRVANGRLDMGAFELQAGPATSAAGTAATTAANAGQVQLFNVDGTLRGTPFQPFVGFNGAVRVATGDVNGDGTPDIIAATGSGAAAVKVFDGVSGAEIRSFIAFAGYSGGLNVASGDIDGDGFDDIIVGTATQNSHVKVFSGASGAEIRSFIAFTGFTGGVTVGSGDTNGDGFDDIIVGSATATAHVKVFNGQTGAELLSFIVSFGVGTQNGISVGAGNFRGPGFGADILVAQLNGGSRVSIFDGSTGVQKNSFEAFAGFGGGVFVSASDVDDNGINEIIVGANNDSGHVKRFDGTNLNLLASFFAFGSTFTGGTSVA